MVTLETERSNALERIVENVYGRSRFKIESITVFFHKNIIFNFH
jgi:hypothetical protein